VASTPVLGASLLMDDPHSVRSRLKFQVSLPLIAQFTFKGGCWQLCLLDRLPGDRGKRFGGIFFASRKRYPALQTGQRCPVFWIGSPGRGFSCPAWCSPGWHLCSWGLLDQLLLARQQHPAAQQLAANARAGQCPCGRWPFWAPPPFGGPLVGWFAEVGRGTLGSGSGRFGGL